MYAHCATTTINNFIRPKQLILFYMFGQFLKLVIDCSIIHFFVQQEKIYFS